MTLQKMPWEGPRHCSATVGEACHGRVATRSDNGDFSTDRGGTPIYEDVRGA